MNVPVLIIGESGDGKSSAFGKVVDENGKVIIEGLDPSRTIILNTEVKPLPITNLSEFSNKIMDSYKKLNGTLDLLLKSGKGLLVGEQESLNYKYDNVVLDSFTSMTEIINRYAEIAFNGFDQWKNYNSMIVEIIIKLKALKQQVFVIAIPEQKDVGFNSTKSYARIKGKELKYGHLEKEFAVVLYTNVVYDEESGEMIDVELMYKPNKNNTAKAPVGLFKTRPRNDASLVVKALKEFYKDDSGREEKEPSKPTS